MNRQMTTNVDELLKPRYKVIAPYPRSESDGVRVGDILTDDGKNPVRNQHGNAVLPFHWEIFPHLFKPLAWYEDREASEMPEYVKEYEAIEGGEGITYVYKKNKDFKYLTGINVIGMRMPNDKRMIHFEYLQPATEAEYQSYINKQK